MQMKNMTKKMFSPTEDIFLSSMSYLRQVSDVNKVRLTYLQDDTGNDQSYFSK